MIPPAPIDARLRSTLRLAMYSKTLHKPLEGELMATEAVPKSVRFFALAVCFYLAAPLFTIPFIKLSLSAPLIFFLFFEVMKSFGGLRLKQGGIWLVLLVIIWFSQLLSLAVNEIFGLESVELAPGLTLILRYAYWFMGFFLAFRLFERSDLPQQVAGAFGWGCVVAAGFVLIEYFGMGGLLSSGWSALTRLSQNGYGWQFSAFFPYLLFLVVTPGKYRRLAILVFPVVMIAIVINASRSNWGTTLLAIVLFAALWLVTSRRRMAAGKVLVVLVLLLGVTGAAFFKLPEKYKERIFSERVTSEQLAYDKSWQIRLLMIQKGLKLFKENPVFGVGPGQFTRTFADLEIPTVLSYGSAENFNKRSSHNSYIMLLAEGGLTFLLPYVLLLSYLCIAGLRAVVRLGRGGELWAIPVWVSTVCFSIHYWTVTGLTSTAPWFLYGLLAAVIAKAKRMERVNMNAGIVNATGVPLPYSR